MRVCICVCVCVCVFVASVSDVCLKCSHHSLHFVRPGDRLEYFDVPLVADSTWETMEKFQVQLINIEQGSAVFGKLKVSTVYLVDDDVYPSSPPEGQTEHTSTSLLWGFLKERWAARHPKPIKSMGCLFYRTIHGLYGTFVLKYVPANTHTRTRTRTYICKARMYTSTVHTQSAHTKHKHNTHMHALRAPPRPAPLKCN